MEYVIVGGSAAAASALAAIRQNRPKAEIRVVADEPVPFYYRPLIPYLLDGSRTADEILFAGQPSVTGEAELIHDRCVALDPARQRIRLQSGRDLSYSKLLLAAGGAPVMLLGDLDGVDNQGVFTLRSMDDAVKIRAYLPGCRTAAVIGGGLVGIKAAEALAKADLTVTVIEQKAQILPLRADPFAAAAIAVKLKKKGVTVLTGQAPQAVTASAGKADGVRLASGRVVTADLVILAVGIRPNVDFLAQSGIAVERGVLADSRMQTSLPNIYAAGDLVQFTDQAAGGEEVSALWSNAVHTGRTAGSNMSGGRAVAPPMLAVMNSTEIAGLPLISAGLLDDPAGEHAVFAETCGDNYRKLLFADDHLVGLLFLGNVNRAGVYVNMIRNRMPLQARRDEVVREVMKF
jgi:NAD(P)H-nitrite reductase large subunit